VTEQRYKAVLAVIGDGRTVGEVARDWGISRRTMHRWLARYEGDGLEGLTYYSATFKGRLGGAVSAKEGNGGVPLAARLVGLVNRRPLGG